MITYCGREFDATPEQLKEYLDQRRHPSKHGIAWPKSELDSYTPSYKSRDGYVEGHWPRFNRDGSDNWDYFSKVEIEKWWPIRRKELHQLFLDWLDGKIVRKRTTMPYGLGATQPKS
jgi:hypothetical protein